LLLSQVLTLYTTPVIYLFFGRISSWLGLQSSTWHEEVLSRAD